MLTIHVPRPAGFTYRPGDVVGGELRLESHSPDTGRATVELWNVEVGTGSSGGRVRDQVELEAVGAEPIPFSLTIPLDAAPAFETEPAGPGRESLRRYWELRARIGAETDHYRIAVVPAPADMGAEALLEADHAPPDDTIWQPPAPKANRRFVTVPLTGVVGAALGALAWGWSWGWTVAAGLLLLLGAGLAFVFVYERRWRDAFDYADTAIRVDRPAYRRGDRVVATVDGAPERPCHAFLEVRERRPGPVERLVEKPLWHSGDRPLLPGASRLVFDLPRDVPPTHEGEGTGIVWRLHVRFTRDPRGLGGGHNPRRTLVVRA